MSDNDIRKSASERILSDKLKHSMRLLEKQHELNREIICEQHNFNLEILRKQTKLLIISLIATILATLIDAMIGAGWLTIDHQQHQLKMQMESK